VLSFEEWLKAPGKPGLLVGVTAFKTSHGSYVYVVKVELWQNVYLERNSKEAVHTPTWSTLSFGINPGLEAIRSNIKDQVDIFINAWLSVNPK
jgi:hypothetical protein